MELVGKIIRFVVGTGAYLVLFFAHVQAQNMGPEIEFAPKSYTTYRISDSVKVDGKLQEKSWSQVRWTDSFMDIEGEDMPRPQFETKVKMLWDDTYFYIAAQLEEPHLWATLTERDAIIFHENNFEVFIDPDGDTHNYYELEVNALGTFWDLMLTKPYRDGGDPIDAWDMRGLKVGIDLDGTLNDPTDTDSGWTVELALPWKALEEAAPEGRPPNPGEQWRVNFSRVQWKIEDQNGEYVKKSDTEDNWVWSPQGVINMHYPEMWGYVLFSDDSTESIDGHGDISGMHPKEQVGWYLRQLYYRQHNFQEENNTYSDRLEELQKAALRRQMNSKIDYDQWAIPRLLATDHTFEISIKHFETGKVWYIREDGRIWSE